ncbi:hypothetical protein [Microvirga pudoricolor]|uniref:hypothetical protein n=1 Tax=Microvirga pudoricolor TaxID=2778729 RepID=UPI0019501BBE|nr:hypothetical protein [Microvirga pudoricolor]MBM6596721.1 hypothetical protein [Microvirga pudoricolor]
MKLLAVTLAAATLLGATAASSQSIQLGPNGPSVDFRSQEQRQRDEWREQRARDRAYRTYDRDTTGTIGRRDCREVVVRERDEFGNTDTRREVRCRR